MLKELEEFKKFKETYQFTQLEIIEIDGKEYCLDYPLYDEDGKAIGQCDKWINIGYRNSGSLPKVLSNLYPYEFELRGIKLSSIESFFQGIKFVDKNLQTLAFSYSGTDAVHIKGCSDYDWKQTGKIYWQGEEIDRYSKEYEDLVDELYISAIQNSLYRNALKKCEVDLIHSIGDTEKNNTVFTRYEFEKQINCLKDFIRNKDTK